MTEEDVQEGKEILKAMEKAEKEAVKHDNQAGCASKSTE